MTLPIMVFAPNLLRPQLGYIFDVDWVEPYESLVGILWKYVKMNSFATPWLVEQIINSALPVDPYAARLSATQPTDDMLAVARRTLTAFMPRN